MRTELERAAASGNDQDKSNEAAPQTDKWYWRTLRSVAV
jgi:hypothetical protein